MIPTRVPMPAEDLRHLVEVAIAKARRDLGLSEFSRDEDVTVRIDRAIAEKKGEPYSYPGPLARLHRQTLPRFVLLLTEPDA